MTGEPLDILLIGTFGEDANRVHTVLQDAGFKPRTTRIHAAESLHVLLTKQPWDLIIADCATAVIEPLAALKVVQQSHVNIPFIVVADAIGERAAVNLIKAGISDYLSRDELSALPDVVRRELREAQVRKQTDAELQRCEARITAAFNQATVGMAESNMQTGQFTLVNDCFCQMTGYTQAELSGMTVADLTHPEDVAASKQAIRRLFAGEIESFTLEKRYVRKDGISFWASTTVYLVHMTDGQDTCCLAMVQDISDRKQAETLIQNLVFGTAATTGKDFFPALVSYISTKLNVPYATISEKVDETTLRTLAYWANGVLQPNFTYGCQKTPCEAVLHLGELYCPSGVQAAFPEDADLVRMGVDSYLGTALYDSEGEVIGDLCVLGTGPLPELQQAQFLLRIFAARAAAELERQRATTAMETLNQSLEIEVGERTKALVITQTAVDLAADNVFLIRPDGHFQYVNNTACTKLGYSRNELLQMTSYDINPMVSAERWAEIWWRLKMQSSIVIESQHQTKQGQIFPVEISARYLKLDGQEYGLSFVRDITERKKSYQVARLLSNVVESTDDAIVTLNFDGIITSWNPGAVNLFGYAEAEAMGQSISILAPPERLQEVPHLLRRLHQGERIKNFETTRQRKDGTLIDVSASISPLRDEAGQIVGSSSIVRDISERKQSEQENQQLKERLQFLLASNPAVIYSLDPGIEKRLTFVSDNIEMLAGYNPQEFLNNQVPWNSYIHPDDFRRLKDEVVAFEEDVHQYEYRFKHRDGHYIWVRSGLKLVRDEQGQTTELIGYTVDVSDRKEAELELQHTNQELARATRLKDEFLANMSHELRTPLNAILGMTEGLSDQIFGEVSDRQLHALKTIERSSSHLLALINDILDVAKIESGQLELELRDVPLTSLFKSSLAFVKQQAHSKQIQIETILQPQLPNLYVDERRLRQVLINLLDNAVKFTDPGGRIVLSGYLAESQDSACPSCLISVSDTGIGIAPEQVERLFQPFVQIDSTLNRKYDGTGLGLALVKRIVELHGGTISVVSTVGSGSCFALDLPYAIGAPLQSQPISGGQLSASIPLTSSINAPLILLAEDNKANISTISNYLDATGYRVLIAQNGQDAIAMVQSMQPDLVLMDIQMPEMDGLEALAQIRHQPQGAHLPIIALTALAMPGDRERCLAAGANTYMSKPVQMKALVNTIEQLLTHALVSG